MRKALLGSASIPGFQVDPFLARRGLGLGSMVALSPPDGGGSVVPDHSSVSEVDDNYRAALKENKPGQAYKRFTSEVKVIDDAKRQIEFVISTIDVDRSGDTVNPDGWDLKNYKKNPVVLFAHDYYQLPVAKCVKVWVEGGKLRAIAEFPTKEVYPFADTVFQMLKGGFLTATSVGFLPTKWQFVENDNRPYGIDFLEQELLEFSIVPIPCNPHALMGAKDIAKSFNAGLKAVFDKSKAPTFVKTDLEMIYRLTMPLNTKDNADEQATAPAPAPAVVEPEAEPAGADSDPAPQPSDNGGSSTDGEEVAPPVQEPEASATPEKSVAEQLKALTESVAGLKGTVDEMKSGSASLPASPAKGSIAAQLDGGKMLRISVSAEKSGGGSTASVHPKIKVNPDMIARVLASSLKSAVGDAIDKLTGKVPKEGT